MPRPKKSKKKPAKDLHAAMTDPACTPAALDGPPDRLAEYVEAQEVETEKPNGVLIDNRTARHPAIDEAAEAYNRAKLERVALSKRESETRQALLLKMVGHKLTRYKTTDGWWCEIDVAQKVKTTRQDGESVESVTYGAGFGDDLEKSDNNQRRNTHEIRR